MGGEDDRSVLSPPLSAALRFIREGGFRVIRPADIGRNRYRGFCVPQNRVNFGEGKTLYQSSRRSGIAPLPRNNQSSTDVRLDRGIRQRVCLSFYQEPTAALQPRPLP